MKAVFFKDRQKFSAAHFTLFADGSAERLHGHNYSVRVAFSGERLELGLLAPFHVLKAEIANLCEAWDEYVLLPKCCPWGQIDERTDQVDFILKTPKLSKRYSFPKEDVRLLNCDNVSCEQLTRIFAEALAERIRSIAPQITGLQVALAESPGQWVEWDLSLEANRD